MGVEGGPGLRLSRRRLLGMVGALPLFPSSVRAAAGQKVRTAVPLDAISVDLLASLDVTPIGAGEARSYRPRLADVSLAKNVLDIGFASEPNLELLSALKPDIFLSAWKIENAGFLKRIAPLLSLNLYSGQPDAYDAVKDGLTTTARALDRQAASERAIHESDSAIERCARRLDALPRPLRLYLADLSFGSGRVGIYGSHSLPHAVLNRLGLENAWKEPDERWGWVSVGLARLADDPTASIVWLQRYGPSGTSTERRLMRSALWHALPAVMANRVIGLPPIDFFGGLRTATRFGSLLTNALLDHAQD